jgi:hypothetical protein
MFNNNTTQEPYYDIVDCTNNKQNEQEVRKVKSKARVVFFIKRSFSSPSKLTQKVV